jgi:light-regulated signal transduction histidine kinase (bacteriophytochrome)
LNGFVNLLEKNTLNKLNEKERHYVQVISESALKLDRQLKDILSFSRMGRAEMNCSRIDLNLLLEEALTLVEPEWENREIIWFRSPLPLVSGDPTMLLTVLVNLISNALKFTSREQQTIITIGHHPDDPDEVIVFIRDNGVGFNMQYQDKLFNLFQRLHPESNFAGTGLGLANMRRIITRHGGRVWAEGKEGEGATFYFSLPKTRANE